MPKIIKVRLQRLNGSTLDIDGVEFSEIANKALVMYAGVHYVYSSTAILSFTVLRYNEVEPPYIISED